MLYKDNREEGTILSTRCIRIGLMDGSTCDFDPDTHKAEVTENWVKVYGGFMFTDLKLCLSSKIVGCVFFDYKYKEDRP